MGWNRSPRLPLIFGKIGNYFCCVFFRIEIYPRRPCFSILLGLISDFYGFVEVEQKSKSLIKESLLNEPHEFPYP